MSIIDKLLVALLESGMPLCSYSSSHSKLHRTLSDDLRMASLLFAMYQVRGMAMSSSSSKAAIGCVEVIEQVKYTPMTKYHSP
ncbi:hypothetical protein EON65_53600 [archaeon]|nr:MAG: hypothetical protein EON65_53600 [archaeon]